MVPTYNGAAFVAETLASLAAQTYPALRVLVSDDASTDGTAAICASVAAADPRVTVVRQPARLGWTANSNALLACADGELAFFATHDDLFAPTYVERAVAALAERSDAVLAYSDTVTFGAVGESIRKTAARTVRPGTRLQRGLRYVLGDDSERWIPMRGVARTAVLRSVGGLRAWRGREYEADGRFLFRLHLLGPFVRVAEVLCRKRRHGAALHDSWPHRRARYVVQRAAYAREVLDADLRASERATLLAAVATVTALSALPWRLRWRSYRMLARLAG